MKQEDIEKVAEKMGVAIARLQIIIKLKDALETDFYEGVLFGYKSCIEALEIPIEIKGKEIYFAGTKIPD